MTTAEYRDQVAKPFGIEWDRRFTAVWDDLHSYPGQWIATWLTAGRYELADFIKANKNLVPRATTSNDFPNGVDKNEYPEGFVNPSRRAKRIRAMQKAYHILCHLTDAELNDMEYDDESKEMLSDWLKDTAHYRDADFELDHHRDEGQGLDFLDRIMNRFQKYMGGSDEMPAEGW